jgi:hypothetical protein
MTRTDIESFFRTLLLGDFDEHQNTSAQLVGGLISLVPVLDQVMDARDITGALFRINQRGGMQHAGADQLVNLGFAAFGAVPEIGSAFKTVFKPLWKERRAAKGAMHGGADAVEHLLGMRKGGAIAWIRNELLGKWNARTQAAIGAVDAALAACIALTEFMASAGGWKEWLIPDSIQAMARELLPSLKQMQSQIRGALQRASNEIREFLQDLLGEQTAAAVMAVGQRAAIASAVPGTRSRSGHNAAAAKPQGSAPARQPQRQIQGKDEANAQRGGGPVHTAVQRTARGLKDLAAREKGLIGEHVADYHEARRLGGAWPHDRTGGAWSPVTVRKLNVDKRPVNLSLQDLPKVNRPGIDAVWEHQGRYTVTEAKASASIAAAHGFGKYKEGKGIIPVVRGLNPDHQLLHYLLSDSSDKGGAQGPLMQMSKGWVEDRSRREGLQPSVATSLAERNAARFSRRVVLVTFEADGAVDHAEALGDAHLGKTAAEVHSHMDHSVTREWEAAAIDAVEAARVRAHEAKKAASAPTQPVPQAGRRKKIK